jgi:hypothetical protein
MKRKIKIKRRIITFMIFLALSGITAFPLRQEAKLLKEMQNYFPDLISSWIERVTSSIENTPEVVLYGTDWLAFAHIVIAIAFIGPLRDPVKNIWVIEFGMIACVLIFPLAFICGPLREIPFFHQLIDCSFGVFGFLLLKSIHSNIKQLRYEQTSENSLLH